jgi:hypothetical protein
MGTPCTQSLLLQYIPFMTIWDGVCVWCDLKSYRVKKKRKKKEKKKSGTPHTQSLPLLCSSLCSCYRPVWWWWCWLLLLLLLLIKLRAMGDESEEWGKDKRQCFCGNAMQSLNLASESLCLHLLICFSLLSSSLVCL